MTDSMAESACLRRCVLRASEERERAREGLCLSTWTYMTRRDGAHLTNLAGPLFLLVPRSLTKCHTSTPRHRCELSVQRGSIPKVLITSITHNQVPRPLRGPCPCILNSTRNVKHSRHRTRSFLASSSTAATDIIVTKPTGTNSSFVPITTAIMGTTVVTAQGPTH